VSFDKTGAVLVDAPNAASAASANTFGRAEERPVAVLHQRTDKRSTGVPNRYDAQDSVVAPVGVQNKSGIRSASRAVEPTIGGEHQTDRPDFLGVIRKIMNYLEAGAIRTNRENKTAIRDPAKHVRAEQCPVG
jgi:hypothetical protein